MFSPYLGYLIVTGSFEYALGFMVIAGVSDWVRTATLYRLEPFPVTRRSKKKKYYLIWLVSARNVVARLVLGGHSIHS